MNDDLKITYYYYHVKLRNVSRKDVGFDYRNWGRYR